MDNTFNNIYNIKEYNLRKEIHKMEENKSNGVGFGVASLVSGVLSIVTIEFIIVSIIFAIIAIIFGIMGVKKGNKGLSKAGLVLGIVSLAITFLLFLFLEVLDISLFTIPSWYK